MYAPEEVDLTLAQRDKILYDTGVKFTKEYFIKSYGLEEDDFEIRENTMSTAADFPNFKEFKEEPAIIGQKQIEDLYKFLSETEIPDNAKEMLSPLINLIENCSDYDEVYEILTDKNLKSKRLEETLQKAIFLCELQGRSDGLDE